MNTVTIIEEACANIASISERLEKHCTNALQIIEDMKYEELSDEYDAYLDERENKEEHSCGNCMPCLGLSWKDFYN